MSDKYDPYDTPTPALDAASARAAKHTANLNMTKLGLGGIGGSVRNMYASSRIGAEDNYFDKDDGEQEECEYQPAPDSPSHQTTTANVSSDSDDPLDAFMAGIAETVEKEKVSDKNVKKKNKQNKGVRQDIDTEDIEESYYRYMTENPMAGVIVDDDDNPIEYDEDGNVIITERNRLIDPLPPVDHGDILYQKFDKNFYEEHEEIKALSSQEVENFRKTLGIRISGIQADYKPVSSFAHFNFDEDLMKGIRKLGFTSPTAIQSQAIPVSLSGRDVIGIAETGSGKTAAFIWPLLVHIMAQGPLQPGDGPIGLICAPTRELSIQIYQEAKRFGKVYNITVVCTYGGGNLYEQTKALEAGAEIVVCTPGRLIDLIKKKALNLQRVTYLIFDEADRMFDMGFEPQVRSIANNVRPGRQTSLFSATFKRKIERLCRDILIDPIRIIQGDIGVANQDVSQYVRVLSSDESKWMWLKSNLVDFTSSGTVLIFVTRKENCSKLWENINANDFNVGIMHGDMDQNSRNEVITKFKKKEIQILIATDVAARGLDISHIRTVVNFEVARDIDTHTHRVGRTGRAGTKGNAFTLITERDREFAGHLVRNFESANQEVSEELINLANMSNWFKNSRFKKSKLHRMGGSLLKARPGLGSTNATKVNSSSLTRNYGTHSIDGNVNGGKQNRLSNMKAAFSAQYNSNFVRSEESEAPSRLYTNPSVETDKPITKRRKTRWE